MKQFERAPKLCFLENQSTIFHSLMLSIMISHAQKCAILTPFFYSMQSKFHMFQLNRIKNKMKKKKTLSNSKIYCVYASWKFSWSLAFTGTKCVYMQMTERKNKIIKEIFAMPEPKWVEFSCLASFSWKWIILFFLTNNFPPNLFS